MERRIAKALARGLVYEYLSVGFLYPEPATFEFVTERHQPARAALLFLRDRETGKALEAFQFMLSQWTVSALEEEYCRVFTHTISQECPPYEGEYNISGIFQKSQVIADIAGFYRAFGLRLSPSFKERPDHISAELEFMHFLTRKEAFALQRAHDLGKADLCLYVQKGFLESHLNLWLPLFQQRLENTAKGGPYGLLGKMAGDFLRREIRALRLAPASMEGLSITKKADEGSFCYAHSCLKLEEVEPCL